MANTVPSNYPQDALLPGTRINGYVIKNVLGRGTFGITYLAEEMHLERLVAIKEYLPELAATREGGSKVAAKSGKMGMLFHQELDNFLEEAKTLVKFNHPNVVRVLTYFPALGTAYMVMEYEVGMDLNQYLKQHPNPSEQTLLAIFSPIVQGLAAVHSSGYIHRDIKAGNIYIREDNSPVLLDFGAARNVINSDVHHLTRILTVGYAPYEQDNPSWSEQGPWTDIYSLAATLYFCILSKRPVSSTDRAGALFSGQEDPIKSIRALRPDGYSLNFLSAIDKALRFKPEERPQTALEWDLMLNAQPRDVTAMEQPRDATVFKTVGGSVHRVSALIRIKNILSLLFNRTYSNQTNDYEKDSNLTRIQPSLNDDLVGENVGNAREFHQEIDETIIFGEKEKVGVTSRLVITASPDPTSVGKQYLLSDAGPAVLGRDSSADFVILDPSISRKHAVVDSDNNLFVIKDTESNNGVYVNGSRIPVDIFHKLYWGDIIHLGSDTSLRINPDKLTEIPDLEGHIFGQHYRLENCIHRSAKTALYIASDRRLPRKVTIKILSPDFASYPGFLDQIRQEAEIASSLTHPQICEIYDFGKSELNIENESKTITFLCMQHMEGGSLSNRLNNSKVIQLSEAEKILDKISQALHHIHKHNVIHAGIRPNCIVFDKEGAPYITDFSSAYSSNTVPTGAIIGSPAFLAPEQLEGGTPTHLSDQYSLACVFYYMTTGSRPFERQEDPDVRRKNYSHGPVPAHIEAKDKSEKNYPESVSNVLRKALSKIPDNRYPSIIEFSNEISKAISFPIQELNGKKKVFISYQRNTSTGWAQSITDTLKTTYELEVFLDVRNEGPSSRFPVRIETEIVQSDVFICLLGKNTLASKQVDKEIQIAFHAKKVMIPVIQDDFDSKEIVNSTEPHVIALLEHDWVRLLNDGGAYFDAAISKLVVLIDS